MKYIIALFMTICTVFELVPKIGSPCFTVDAANTLGEVSSRATGFLYGLAEDGVPTDNMCESLDISSVSQKTIDGLQHPTGDVDKVADSLENCDYITVYLQDCFDTWYYCTDEINALRAAGNYSPEAFVRDKYFPLVREQVEKLSEKPYADRLVYCIYNECDNGVWFGEADENGNIVFNEKGRENFYRAWKTTYDLVKSIAPQALIGGPGYCDYITEKTEDFLTFCKENSCVPDIMIYHELSVWSLKDFGLHVEDYRNIEARLGIEELPIIVTEYACPDECGMPSVMLGYVAAIEYSGVWGNVAFWRLANNLNDTCADANTPNANWWVYRKYADMEGQLLGVTTSAYDEAALYGGDNDRYAYTGIAALSNESDRIDVICSARETGGKLKIENLDETKLNGLVDVKIECVYYKGIFGEVSSPVTVREYSCFPLAGRLEIPLGKADNSCVYFVCVAQSTSQSFTLYRNRLLPERYEAENGVLTGNAYTYDSFAASTGEPDGLAGGFEQTGDGVEIEISAPLSGKYTLDIIFGNSNDGSTSQDRDFTKANFTIDGEGSVISFPNTIRSEYTDCLSLELELKEGTHILGFSHLEGTFVLDSLLLTPCTDETEIYVMPDSDRSTENKTSFLAVAPDDGFYEMSTAGTDYSFELDGSFCDSSDNCIVYLQRGLNYLDFFTADEVDLTLLQTDFESYDCFSAEMLTLEGSAELITDKYGNSSVDSISDKSGSASFTVNAPEDGAYRLTLLYANNAEGGVHSYNVDLIEQYVTVTANGASQDVFCRNTYSLYTYKTVTVNVTLQSGENTIVLSNSGNTRFNSGECFAPRITAVTVNTVYIPQTSVQ